MKLDQHNEQLSGFGFSDFRTPFDSIVSVQRRFEIDLFV